MDRHSNTLRPRPLDHGDPRTPMAWQHRNINYQQQHLHVYPERFSMVPPAEMTAEKFQYQHSGETYLEEMVSRGTARPQQYQSRPRTQTRPVSPSTGSSGTTSSTEEPDTDSQCKYDGNLALREMIPPPGPPTLGTLRSVHSTLTTWDGEPCPVHHVAVPVPVLLPAPPPCYPMMAFPPPPPPPPPALLLPPMMRPRPLVMPAESPAPLEPLPVRDPKASISPIPPKEVGSARKQVHCCKGHIVVLWIILAIIFVGVLLGVVLRFVVS